MSKVILVTGATGNQGGAVVDALLKAKEDFQIIALTRNATSPSAKRLAAKSSAVKVLQGDMNQPQLVFSEAKKLVGEPVWGVFMVQVGEEVQRLHLQLLTSILVSHCWRRHSRARGSPGQEVHRHMHKPLGQVLRIHFCRPRWRG